MFFFFDGTKLFLLFYLFCGFVEFVFFKERLQSLIGGCQN